MLNGLVIAKASLHTAFPGSAGTNEVTGGTYAQLACTFSAEAGGTRTLSAPLTFNVPATTVEWVGFRDSSGVMKCCAPNGGLPLEFYVDPASSAFYSAGHGYAANQLVVVYGGVVPGGLTQGTKYYVVNQTANTFQLSATSGGSPITITSVGDGSCVVSRISSDVYGASSTHTISSCTIGLPF